MTIHKICSSCFIENRLRPAQDNFGTSSTSTQRSRLRTHGSEANSAPAAPESAPHQRLCTHGFGTGFYRLHQKTTFSIKFQSGRFIISWVNNVERNIPLHNVSPDFAANDVNRSNSFTTSRLSLSTNILVPSWALSPTEPPASRYLVFVALIFNQILAASRLSWVYASYTFAVVLAMMSMSSVKPINWRDR